MKKILHPIIALLFIFAAAFAFAAPPALSTEPGGVVLVLSGGGTRGVAHVGVLKFLEEEKIPLVGIVGTSMGSIVGGIAACGYSADQIMSIILDLDLTNLFYNRNVPSSSPLGKEANTEAWAFYRMLLDEEGDRVGPLGALTGIRLFDELRRIVKPCSGIHDFNELPIPFAAVATDLGRGDAVVIRRGSLADAMRASMSIPGLFEPWRLDGRLMVDGGLVANLPVRIAKRLFPGYPVIAVDISGASRTEEEINTTVDVLDQAVNIMTSRELRRDIEAADLLIRPHLGQMPMLQTKKLDSVILAGLQEAKNMAPRIRELAMNAPPMAAQNRMAGIENHPLIKECSCEIADIPEDNRLKAAKEYKYEVLLGGKYSTFSDHNWLYADVITRDFREKDDTMTYSLIAGEEWGLGLKYLNAGQKWKQRTETSLFMRRRVLEPRNAPHTQWYRFSGSYTERFFLGSLRAGIGFAAEYYDGDVGSDHFLIPTLFVIHNSLDDEVDPTSGMYARADIWWPDADEIIARLDVRKIHSFSDKMRMMLRAGVYIGDEEYPFYTAYLGGREELYSLSQNPLAGENMAWWRAMLRNVVVKDWWGTLNLDFFYSRGYLMNNSFDTLENPWEVGVALSLPGSLFNGRLILVYDDEEEWTLGLTIGIPAWEEGPVP